MKTLINEIEEKVEELNFSGVISIYKNNEFVFNKAYGYRDVSNRLKNDTSTIFGIASGTKLFTALGIGVLIDQGKLSLETKISQIDPKYTGYIHEDATLRQLLSHTSGVYDYLDEDVIEDYNYVSFNIPWYELETPTAHLPLFEGKTYKSLPGETCVYNNGGYVLLAAIIENVSGELFRDFIAEHVLKPAGMHHSGFFALNDLPGNTANGYLEDRRTTNIFKIAIRGGGDGGMYTTTQDLVSMWKAFFGYKILSKELTDEYLKTQSMMSESIHYGLGIYKGAKQNYYFIVGGDAGVGFDSRYYPEEDLIVNILTNLSDGENEIRDILIKHLAK